MKFVIISTSVTFVTFNSTDCVLSCFVRGQSTVTVSKQQYSYLYSVNPGTLCFSQNSCSGAYYILQETLCRMLNVTLFTFNDLHKLYSLKLFWAIMQHNLSANIGLREISEMTLKFTKKKKKYNIAASFEQLNDQYLKSCFQFYFDNLFTRHFT